jgi:hypothetical protein
MGREGDKCGGTGTLFGNATRMLQKAIAMIGYTSEIFSFTKEQIYHRCRL